MSLRVSQLASSIIWPTRVLAGSRLVGAPTGYGVLCHTAVAPIGHARLFVHKNKYVGEIKRKRDENLLKGSSHCGWANHACAELEFITGAPNHPVCTERGLDVPTTVFGVRTVLMLFGGR
jgi:hypothetical protein